MLLRRSGSNEIYRLMAIIIISIAAATSSACERRKLSKPKVIMTEVNPDEVEINGIKLSEMKKYSALNIVEEQIIYGDTKCVISLYKYPDFSSGGVVTKHDKYVHRISRFEDKKYFPVPHKRDDDAFEDSVYLLATDYDCENAVELYGEIVSEFYPDVVAPNIFLDESEIVYGKKVTP